ncbi:MAG TPA: c-type cytochrome [Gemmataceae bacterium]|nr:c-type cytochrome [Gemmataceae bacterium]
MILRRSILAFVGVLLAGVLARAALEGANNTPRPIYKSPLGLAVDPTSQIAYVALHTADALAVVDLKNNEVVDEIAVGRKPYDVALHKGIAYVTCEADDTLVLVDVLKRKVLRRFKVGQAPRGVAVHPRTGHIRVVCHDARELWTLTADGEARQEPLPPQPEGNFARASSFEITFGDEPGYTVTPRPYGLFTHGQSVFDQKPSNDRTKLLMQVAQRPQQADRSAFNPVLDIDLSRTSMDMVAHTRARWFTPTAQAPEGRIFTNALSFFTDTTSPAAVVLLDEEKKGYPDPTDVVVKFHRNQGNKSFVALPTTKKPAPSPLNGAVAFISSGGADTVVVIDLMKAASHFLNHRLPINQLGFTGFGGWGGGGFSGVGFGGTMQGNFGSGTFSGTGLRVPGGFNGMPPQHPFPPKSSGITAKPGSQPAITPGGPPITNFLPGQFGGQFSGQFGGQFGGSFQGVPFGGWSSFSGLGGFAPLIEDLKASKNYTLKRIATQANPRRMVLTPDGKTLVVSNHLSDSLTLIDTERLTVLRHIDLGGPRPDEARRGEILFHSAKHTVQQQFSCASCHPGGGSDGLAWDTSDKGTGEHLNSRDLHGVRDTRPFGWKGESETLANRVKNTMRHVHKHKISDKDANAVAAFLQTLDPCRPLPHKKSDEPAIARGKELFFGKAGCTRCHRGPAYTSPSPKAVIADFQGKMTEFDVPSLRGVGRSAPYLHDGRAAKLEDIFKQHNPHRRHGKAHELSDAELIDLVAFLKSL